MDKIIKKINIYPFILSIYPAIALSFHNRDSLLPISALGDLLLIGVGVGFFWTLLRVLVKKPHKADMIVAVSGLMFFSFEHILKVVSIILITINGQTFEASERFGRWLDHPETIRPIIITWALFLGLCIYLLIKTSTNLEPVSLFLNYVAIVLVIFLAVNIASTFFSQSDSKEYLSDWQKRNFSIDTSILHCPEQPPDIYYLILDSYARRDVLQKIYNYDNSEFYDFLSTQGFLVIEQSQSNYAQTPLSLASSLNFMYLDFVVSELGKNSKSRIPLQQMIFHNKISVYLQHCGYKIIVFSSGFSLTDIQSGVEYIAPKYDLSDFQNELLNLTPIPFFLNMLSLSGQYQLHRERILFTLDQLPKIGARYNSPIFVFSHMTIPHHPFVFDAAGNPIDSGRLFALAEDFANFGIAEYIEGYRDQLIFTNSMMRNTLPEIISNSPNPPVIILQSDHGPTSQVDWNNIQEVGLFERMSILNAYYFPGVDYSYIPSTISPVNTFRLLLNNYFDAHLPLVEDMSYFSTLEFPYRLETVDPFVGSEIDIDINYNQKTQ